RWSWRRTPEILPAAPARAPPLRGSTPATGPPDRRGSDSSPLEQSSPSPLGRRTSDCKFAGGHGPDHHAAPDACRPCRLLPADVHEDPAEVVGVLLDAVVERLDVLALEESQNVLLELAGSLARDDLHQRCLLGDRFLHDRVEGALDLPAAVVDVMQ